MRGPEVVPGPLSDSTFLCPECGGVEVDANTWEAWCGDCGWRVTDESHPDVYAGARTAGIARRHGGNDAPNA